MSEFWQDTIVRKLALTVFGIGVILATSSPQTADKASTFLAERGYSDIALMPPRPNYGRGRLRFPFAARAQGGERVSGEVWLGSFAWFYSIHLDNKQPAQ